MNDDSRRNHYMSIAIKEAKKAAKIGEVPVGAVIVRGEKVISKAHNRRETGKNALYHAEITAISRACRRLHGWRLEGCELYVTLEPCPMCAGAIVNSRIKTVIYGASDPKAGAVTSKISLFDSGFNHKPDVEAGIMEKECSSLLSDFFAELRLKRKFSSGKFKR